LTLLIISAVHSKGSLIFLQLWHTGRQSHPSFHESNEVVAPSAIGLTSGTTRDINHESVPYVTPRALTIDEIKQTVDDYANSAKLAKAAGL
jgi:2,4-dienoyl-CoA reductase-like NADH-dependent reductase (Old Yellow Enzyme family)